MGSPLAAALEAARQDVAQRRADLHQVASDAPVEGRDDEHDPDGATAAFEHALAVGLLAAAEERLAALEQAAARAEVGTYGTCERCGRPIDLERLAARPEAATCAACSPSRRGLSWSS